MKIFITGIAGFLGSHLADRMLELGHEVSGNDTLIGGYIENVPKDATFFNIDCCDIKLMSEAMQGANVVIHAAATAHEGLSVFSPSFITKNIFEASVATISAAIQNKVQRFVYCSSMARYGNINVPFHEFDSPKPTDPYGVAKLAGEEVLKILGETHGMEWNIAVPHNIVGARQRYDDPFRNVMSIMINRNLMGKPSIIYGDGLQTRCFSHVDDCVFCLEKLALDPNITSEIVNIGPDEGIITIKDLAEIIAEELDFKEPPVFLPDRPREVKHASCSADKAINLLGYNQTVDVRRCVRETIEYIKEHGVKEFDYSYPLEIVTDNTPTTWKDRIM
jgi:UDP-glucose 4-epimerase